jgi:hypothetical protein
VAQSGDNQELSSLSISDMIGYSSLPITLGPSSIVQGLGYPPCCGGLLTDDEGSTSQYAFKNLMAQLIYWVTSNPEDSFLRNPLFYSYNARCVSIRRRYVSWGAIFGYSM